MALNVTLPTILSRLADGQRILAAEGSSVGDAVADLSRRFPALAPRLTDERGEPYPFITYYLNDEDIRFSGGFAAPVQEGDELVIVSAVAGG